MNMQEIKKISFGEDVKTKQKLTYVPWARAWDKMLELDPNAVFTYLPEKSFGDTFMVYCELTAFGITRVAHLPVMDHANRPITNPDCVQVNKAMQRALVKACALFGLGLYIYEDDQDPAIKHALPQNNEQMPTKSLETLLQAINEAIDKKTLVQAYSEAQEGYKHDKQALGKIVEAKDQRKQQLGIK